MHLISILLKENKVRLKELKENKNQILFTWIYMSCGRRE
jgi:hypothetical protein